MGFEWLKPGVVLGSLVYALIGVVIFWVCFLTKRIAMVDDCPKSGQNSKTLARH